MDCGISIFGLIQIQDGSAFIIQQHHDDCICLLCSELDERFCPVLQAKVGVTVLNLQSLNFQSNVKNTAD